MYQNYNYYPQNQPSGQQPLPNYLQPSYLRQAQPQVTLKGRLVSSLEEARATSIDFDGSIFYFPDLANKQIYTKQINMDGTATMNVYELKEFPVVNQQQVTPSMDNFITRDEFEKTIGQIRTILLNNNNQQVIQPTVEKPQTAEILNF